MIMKKKFYNLPTRTNMMVRALNRRVTGADVMFEKVDDTMDNHPNQLSVLEQLMRMQRVVAEAGERLGAFASQEEYEMFLNRALRRNGILNMRAVVALNYEES
ncbi:MAG: hypothetical protein FWC50_01790 [Planctomycetaceae bacterium]|nr:hypothetical protein [Planctomycetaceae bacterium]